MLYNIMVTLVRNNSYDSSAQSGIGGNSADLKAGDFVQKSDGYVIGATAGSIIVGTSKVEKVYASDNQTNAQEVVTYVPSTSAVYSVEISGGTITQADEGKFYDLSDKDTVDGTTEDVATGQLVLVKYVTPTLGHFSIANK